MAGPKFDLEWEFGTRLTGMSAFASGYLVVSSSSARHIQIDDFEVFSNVFSLYRERNTIAARLAFLRNAVGILRKSRKERQPIDLIVTYDPLATGFVGWMLSRIFGAKLICEVNGEYAADANYLHVKSRTVRTLKKWMVRQAAAFILARAAGIKVLFDDQLAGLGFSPRGHQVVKRIPEFVNTSVFSEIANNKVILLVGFPYYVKGVDVAVAAFSRICNKYPDWQLHIVGHYPDSSDIDKAISVCPRIVHIKPVRHRAMNEHIGSCGIVLQASRTEAMGRVLVEAMAAGKPRVATRVGGIPTVIDHEMDGILVESEDIDALAHALSRLMGSQELRHRLGAAAKQRAAREFVPEQYFDRIRQLFDAVAGVNGSERNERAA